MQPYIVYLLRATVQGTSSRDGISPESRTIVREIPLTPISTATPPLEIQDFPEEYNLVSKRNLRQRFWNTVLGMLDVSSVEPPALNMISSVLRPSTVALLRLTFQPLSGGAIFTSPFERDIIVQSAISAKTFYSTEPMFKEHPTLVATRKSRVMNVDTLNLTSECRILRSHSWQLDRQLNGEIGGKQGNCSWTTAIEVPINAPKGLPPTFVSVLARRYMLKLEIRMEKCYHLPIILHLPLQVVYELPGNAVYSTDCIGNNENTETSPSHLAFDGDQTATTRYELSV